MLFCSLHFSQKRAKKIEGDSIYIRHSLLMLEVCIPFGDISLCLRFLALWHSSFCLISRLHVAPLTVLHQYNLLTVDNMVGMCACAVQL